MGQPLVIRLPHPRGGYAQAAETSVVGGQQGFAAPVIQHVLVPDFLEFGMRNAGYVAPHRDDGADLGVDQSFRQHALPDHAGGGRSVNCGWLAERQGFEPWVRFHAHTLSKRAP